MKLLVIISIVACSYAANLDNTYLPPSGASSAGGSPGSLTGPFGGPTGQGFGPSSSPALNDAVGTGGSFGFTAGSQGAVQPATQYGPPTGTFGSGSAQTGRTNVQGTFEQSGGTLSQFQPERPRAALDRNAEILRYDNRNDGGIYAYSFETSNGITAEESGVATNGVRAQGGFAYTGDDGQLYRITYTADENGFQPQGEHLPTSPPIPDEILRSLEENARAAAAGIQEGAYNPNEDNQQYSGSGIIGGSQSYQYDTPSAGISRSDTGVFSQNSISAGQPTGSTGAQNQGASQNTYQGAGSQYPSSTASSGSLDINKSVMGGTQASQISTGPGNQYIPPSGQAPGATQQTVLIGYNAQTTAANPTASGPSPSGFAPSGSTVGPTKPTGTSSSTFTVSSTASSGYTPSGTSATGPSPSGFTPSTSGPTSAGPSRSSSGIQSSGFSRTSQQNSQQSDDGYNYNRPQPAFSNTGSVSSTASTQRTGTSGTNPGFIINVGGSTGPAATAQYQSKQSAGIKSTVQATSAPYEYNRPGSQAGTSASTTSKDVRAGQAFGGPRQQPSFSQDEGYKY